MATTPRQNTIAREGRLEGVGLHTGAPVKMRIHPAPVNTGVVFRRADLPGEPRIPALVANVSSTDRGTTLGSGDAPGAHRGALAGRRGGAADRQPVHRAGGPRAAGHGR